MMKFLHEENDNVFDKSKMRNPNLPLDGSDRRPISKWSRLHQRHLETAHPELCMQLVQNGTLCRHLADVNERTMAMLERLTEQMKKARGHYGAAQGREPDSVGRQGE